MGGGVFGMLGPKGAVHVRCQTNMHARASTNAPMQLPNQCHTEDCPVATSLERTPIDPEGR